MVPCLVFGIADTLLFAIGDMPCVWVLLTLRLESAILPRPGEPRGSKCKDTFGAAKTEAISSRVRHVLLLDYNGLNTSPNLLGIDEVVLLLDDNSINLQTMQASRFVAAFAEDVNSWESKLSLISEVTEIWMQVCGRYIALVYVKVYGVGHL